jgi:hypothetical protein
MSPAVGDIIHHQITNEAGRVVRIVEIDGGVAYVVAIKNHVSGVETEALWRPFELKDSQKQDSQKNDLQKKDPQKKNDVQKPREIVF